MPRGRGSPPWDVREVRRRAERAARSIGWTTAPLQRRADPTWEEERVWRREYLGGWIDQVPVETITTDAEFIPASGGLPPETAEAVDAMYRAAYSGLGVDLAAGVRTGPNIQQIPRDPVRAMGEAARRAWTLGEEIRASETRAREAVLADTMLRRLRNISVQTAPAKPTPFKVPLARCAHPGGACPNNCQDRPASPTPLSRWYGVEVSSGNFNPFSWASEDL